MTDEIPIAKKFVATFSNPLGQEVLNHLREHTIETILGNMQGDGMASALNLAHLEGQRHTVKYIEQLIKKGSK